MILINNLDKIFVSFQEFEQGFIELSYTKKNSPSNVKTKYAINKIASYFAEKELFEDDGSVEHIFPESVDTNNGYTNNIGNLILLEQKLNKEADCLELDQKINIYKRSNYQWVKIFIENNKTWSYENVQKRSEELAKLYYTKILNRKND